MSPQNVIDVLKDAMEYTEHPVLQRCGSCMNGEFRGAASEGMCLLNGAAHFSVQRDAACDHFQEQ